LLPDGSGRPYPGPSESGLIGGNIDTTCTPAYLQERLVRGRVDPSVIKTAQAYYYALSDKWSKKPNNCDVSVRSDHVRGCVRGCVGTHSDSFIKSRLRTVAFMFLVPILLQKVTIISQYKIRSLQAQTIGKTRAGVELNDAMGILSHHYHS
jgi:hypothetical protein